MSVARYSESLVTITLVTIHWIHWVQRKPFRKNLMIHLSHFIEKSLVRWNVIVVYSVTGHRWLKDRCIFITTDSFTRSNWLYNNTNTLLRTHYNGPTIDCMLFNFLSCTTLLEVTPAEVADVNVPWTCWETFLGKPVVSLLYKKLIRIIAFKYFYL